METARLIPSAYTRSNTQYVTVADPDNMYANTDNSASYATLSHTRGSVTTYYVYIKGFNIGSIPTGAVVDSFQVKIKGYEYRLNTGANYAPALVNNTSLISGTAASTALTGTVNTITIPTGNLTWENIVSYGSDFGIRVCIRRYSSGNQGYAYIYGAEIVVNYEYVAPSTPVKVKVSGSWVDASSLYVKLNGIWEQATSFFCKRNGSWTDKGLPNYLVYGNPTIDGNIYTPDPNAIGFIYTDKVFNPGAGHSWTIQTKIKYNTAAAWKDFISTADPSTGAAAYSIISQTSTGNSNQSYSLYLSDNGTSWNLMSNKCVGMMATGTWRVFQIVCTYSNGTYTFKQGYPELDSWTATASTSAPPTFQYPIAFGRNMIAADFDLSETKIWIDGALWWEAITE